MLVERINGGWCISDIIEGYLVTRRYFGYTKREAIQLFKAHSLVYIEGGLQWKITKATQTN